MGWWWAAALYVVPFTALVVFAGIVRQVGHFQEQKETEGREYLSDLWL